MKTPKPSKLNTVKGFGSLTPEEKQIVAYHGAAGLAVHRAGISALANKLNAAPRRIKMSVCPPRENSLCRAVAFELLDLCLEAMRTKDASRLHALANFLTERNNGDHLQAWILAHGSKAAQRMTPDEIHKSLATWAPSLRTVRRAVAGIAMKGKAGHIKGRKRKPPTHRARR